MKGTVAQQSKSIGELSKGKAASEKELLGCKHRLAVLEEDKNNLIVDLTNNNKTLEDLKNQVASGGNDRAALIAESEAQACIIGDMRERIGKLENEVEYEQQQQSESENRLCEMTNHYVTTREQLEELKRGSSASFKKSSEAAAKMSEEIALLTGSNGMLEQKLKQNEGEQKPSSFFFFSFCSGFQCLHLLTRFLCIRRHLALAAASLENQRQLANGANESVSLLRRRNDELGEELAKLGEEKALLDIQKDALDSKVADQDGAICLLQTKLTSANAKLDSLEGMKNESDRHLSTLKDKLAAEQEKNFGLTMEIASSSEASKKATAKCDDLEVKLKAAEQEKDELKIAISSLETSNKNSSLYAIPQLESKNEGLKDQLESKTSQMQVLESKNSELSRHVEQMKSEQEMFSYKLQVSCVKGRRMG